MKLKDEKAEYFCFNGANPDKLKAGDVAKPLFDCSEQVVVG